MEVSEEEVLEEEALPAWLLNNPDGKSNNPSIWQRTTIDDSEAVPPSEDFKAVTTFNVKDCSFEEQPPQFDQVRQYADANTIAVAWDLNWPHAEKISALQEEAQKEPEQHLLHYRVERRALDSKEADVVNTISPVKILHRNNKGVLTALKPRFQIVDHFSHETLADQAALPVTGLRYLYNITPIDFAGGTGRPLTLIATRYPNTPPLVPVDAKLVVVYELVPPPKEEEENKTETSEKEVSLEPTLFDPKQQLEVLWTEPQVAAMNTPAISKYQLIFRRSDTMPIGSYGLDSSSQGPRTKSLPASNARPLPGDIVVDLDAFGPRTDRRANLSVSTLVEKGVYPSETEINKDSDENVETLWHPESWRIFIRTVSINNIRSAIVPVQLSLQATSIGKESDEIIERGPEERQPAELEWLPKRINLPFLPPEDEGAVTGDAFFPMPKEDAGKQFRFVGDIKNIGHQRHPAGFRCIRFQWNQGPSQKKAYPLDMNAGYKLLQLDIDAHTTATFKDNDLLAQALQPIQDVQMTEAEDLWLTPDNTLSPSQWEAWYPSIILRRPEENKANPAESDTALKPWYSWRESILVWPEWPGHVRRPESGGAVLHPVLQGIVEALEDNPRDIAGLETYTVDVQALPATLPTTAINFFENVTDARTDPYGWSALQRMGLSVTFSLRKKPSAVGFSEEDNKLITDEEMLKAVHGVLEGYSDSLWIEITSAITKDNPRDSQQDSIPNELQRALNSKGIEGITTATEGPVENQWQLNNNKYLVKRNENRLIVYQEVPFDVKQHVHVELLFKPGKAVDLEKDSTVNADGLLALMQLSLRPSIKQELHYAKMDITGPAGAEALLVFPKYDKQVDLVMQSSSSEETGSEGQSPSHLTVEAGEEKVEYPFTMPLNGKTTVLLRGSKDDIQGDQRDIELWFAHNQPIVEVGSEHLFYTHFEIGDKQRTGYIKVKEPKVADKDKATVREGFKGEQDQLLVGITFSPPEIFDVTNKAWGRHTSYFTAPKNITPYFSSESVTDSSGPEKWTTGGEWTKVKKYLETLNSAKPEGEKIELPVFTRVEDKNKTLENLRPAFLIWAQRFFEAGGQVLEKDVGKKNFQTAEGPWLATAYPRSGTPAYVTPDAQGRLTYDHLIQDRWAHNYRYYIKPYGRYDLLWRSFEESSLLWEEEERRKFREQRDKTETAGLDYNSAALDVVLDRTYPIDKPLVISSRRLDYTPKEQQAKQPGTTWEVIIAKHWEQSLIERNQTLMRQLSFRQIAFTLVRRFSYENYYVNFNRYLHKHEVGTVSIQAVHNLSANIPLTLAAPAKLGADAEQESLALPKRLGRFQQGALVVQMEGLPYYYEHKMILVAQTTTGVSPRNTITQRDFEYQSPEPLVTAKWEKYTTQEEGEEKEKWQLVVQLRLERYWDCLPEKARSHWPHEDADEPLKDEEGNVIMKMKISALPDLDVVYQIVETFSGNVEVQEEIFFELDQDKKAGKFKRRQLGRRFASPPPDKDELNYNPQHPPITPKEPESQTSHFMLEFKLQAAEGTKFESATIISEPLSVTSMEIPDTLANEISFDPVEKVITCTGFLIEDQAKALIALFEESEDKDKDQKKIQNLLNKNVNTLRGRTLKVRARRGAATPVSEAFQAIDILSSKTDGEG
uniref:hypothetical protein n=1 Tax=Candidatus Electrothrix sp. TaxID=2170559 RepID=UPI0040562D9C